jgi:hypothetical protein
MSTEEFSEQTPPDAFRVAQRALVLSAVICRSGIEQDVGNAQAKDFRAKVIEWVERLGLNSEAEPEEMELLSLPLGKLSKKQNINASWQSEALAVLAWALKKSTLPSYDVQADGPAIADSLGFMKEKSHTALHLPQLKEPEEIAALGDHIFMVHWRLRQFSLDKSRMNFEDFARSAWFGPLPLNGLDLLDDDLEIQGVPIFEATEEQWRGALSIAQTRHQTVNWLLGNDPIYSKVTTDT